MEKFPWQSGKYPSSGNITFFPVQAIHKNFGMRYLKNFMFEYFGNISDESTDDLDRFKLQGQIDEK